MNELPTQSSEPAPLGIVDAYLNAWRRVFDYTGVSTRREYWSFVLTHWLVLFPVIGFFSGAWIFEANWMMTTVAGVLVFGHMAVAGIVSLSLTIRRVRDATSSGWFTFLIIANPWLILGIACCPRYDAKALSNLPDGYWDVWRKTADYLGVSKRGEFWSFSLINTVITAALITVAIVALNTVPNSTQEVIGTNFTGSVLLFLAVAIVPWLPLLIRRVRDATSSGWFTFLIFANPWLILGIACCPRYDAKSLANLPDGYWDVWRKTADYLGVSKRGEFWTFSLINLVVTAAVIAFAILVLVTVPGTTNNSTQATFGVIFTGMLVILTLLTVAAVPWVPLLVRRCRDATGSGWVAIVGFVFIPLSLIAVAIICLLPSRESETPAGGRVAARARPEPEEREDDDPWAR